MQDTIVIEKYDYIDSLRGIAIIGVIMVHLSLIGISTPKFFSLGMMGVPLFFIISSFTLCLTYNKRKTIKEKQYNIKFYLRRFFRILPVFIILTLTIFFILRNLTIPGVTFDGSFSNLFIHISFLYGFSQHYIGSMMMGERSLFNEIIFYLFFPFIFTLITKSFKKTILFIGITFIICYLYNIFGYSILGLSRGYIYITPFTHFFSFSLGFLLFSLREYKINKLYLNILYILNIIGFLLLGYIQVYYGTHLFPFFIFNLSLFIFLCSKGGVYHILVNKINSYIGKISYSIYLINAPLLTIYGYLANNYLNIENIYTKYIILLIGAILLLIGVSSLSYYLLENTSVILGKKVINKIE